MGRSDSHQSLNQAGDDEAREPRALGGSFCSPLSCDCGCFLYTVIFCRKKWSYQDEDAAGLQWLQRGSQCVCRSNFSLHGVLASRCLSRQQRKALRCQRKALHQIHRLIEENRGVRGHLRTRSGSLVEKLGLLPPTDCLHWHRLNFPKR